MSLIQGPELHSRLSETDGKRIFIDPLLDPAQIGEVSIDLRLGPDFLVSLLTRRPSVELSASNRRGVNSYFRLTRREVGDSFVLYPAQVVLAVSLEYVGLPVDAYADIIARSSYSRLGIHLNTMIQPGFRGCIPFELVNHSNNPVELVVGSRVVQARLISIGSESNYVNGAANRKYFGNVRPTVSRAPEDGDLAVLKKFRT